MSEALLAESRAVTPAEQAAAEERMRDLCNHAYNFVMALCVQVGGGLMHCAVPCHAMLWCVRVYDGPFLCVLVWALACTCGDDAHLRHSRRGVGGGLGTSVLLSVHHVRGRNSSPSW